MRPKVSGNKYIEEVQGLRTIAALLVAVYHIWFDRISGGVDIFFVVSAYFIAYSLNKFDRLTLINLVDYYRNTLTRILPNASVVFLFTCIFIAFFWPTILYKSEIKNAFFTLLNIENWFLAINGIDYLDSGNYKSAFQQFWALSVQIQFYFVFPFLIYILSFFSKKEIYRLLLFVFVFIFSFGYSVVLTNSSPSWAYFDSFARAWEFAAGFILFYLTKTFYIKKSLGFLLNFLAVISIVFFGYLYDAKDSFPGFMAIIPVSLACLVILTSKSDLRFSILKWKPLVKFGNYSFAFYLWHWPIYIYFSFEVTDNVIDLTSGFIILLVTALLAIISTELVENRIRNNKKVKSSLKCNGSVIIGMLSIMLIGLSSIFILYKHKIDVGNKSLYSHKERDGIFYRNKFVPAPIIIKDDIPESYRNGCHQNGRISEIKHCEYGNINSDVDILLVGGSHSLQWLHPLIYFVENKDIHLHVVTKSACSLTTNGDELYIPSKSCLEWNKKVLDYINNERPDYVITTVTRNSKYGEYIPDGYKKIWGHVEAMGSKIIGIRDNPWFKVDPPLCVELNSENPNSICGYDKELFYKESLSNDLSRIDYIDFSEVFCPDGFCNVVNSDNVIMYRDKHHLSRYYTIYLKDTFFEKLSSVILE